MAKIPDPKKINEQSALNDASRSPSKDAPTKVVLLPPPPTYANLVTPFRTAETANTSQKALTDYRRAYPQRKDYPLRVKIARHTGLPAFINGILPSKISGDESDEGYIEIADFWLRENSFALFGKPEDTIRLRPDLVHRFTAPRPGSSKPDKKEAGSDPSEQGSRGKFDGFLEVTPTAIHIAYQQWVEDDEVYPVFGGRVAVHLLENGDQVSVSNSCFPDARPDPDRPPHLGSDEAAHIPIKVVSAYHEVSPEAWEVHIVPYSDESGSLWLLPFAGTYYLAYQIVCTTDNQAWRLFVDAAEGKILGRPESLIYHAAEKYHASSGALLNGSQPKSVQDPNLVSRIDKHVMEFEKAAIDDELNVPNIATHTFNLLAYFVEKCGAVDLQGYLDAVKHGSSNGPPYFLTAKLEHPESGTPLKMCFNSFNSQILFQIETGDGGLLAADWGMPVHKPGLDPEVIGHELAHGLMWHLQKQSFEQLQQGSVPFGRPLLEGYASYFARSLTEPGDQDTDENWARASYRETDWENLWAFERTDDNVGQDKLAAPNLYPHNDLENCEKLYDLGMLWGRVLWDIRTILQEEISPDVGAIISDRCALNAYYYLQGWTASFEGITEGLIDQLRKIPMSDQKRDDIIERVTAELAEHRNILAERGVQSLVEIGPDNGHPAFLIGTDAGVKRLHFENGTWQLEQWGQGLELEGEVPTRYQSVVALAYDANATTAYAATEDRIYQRDNGATDWSLAGDNWPGEDIPVSITLVDGALYVGTANQQLWRLGGTTWVKWSGGLFKEPGVPLKQALETTTSDRYLYAANLRAPSRRATDSDTTTWESTPAIGNNNAASTTVCILGDHVYTGTLAHGVWRRDLDAANNVGWTQLANAVLQDKAILALVEQGHQLYAGTTAGLYRMDNPPNDVWTEIQIDDLNTPAIITTVLATSNHLLVGTAGQGMRFKQNGNWLTFSWEDLIA